VLVLTRRIDESLVIRNDIVVTVLAVEGDKVKLGIQAPADVTILRQELHDAVRQQNLAAARAASRTAPSLDAVREALQPPPAVKPEPPAEG
jgi:carbon storage regulator